jgi:hypothetical protein
VYVQNAVEGMRAVLTAPEAATRNVLYQLTGGSVDTRPGPEDRSLVRAVASYVSCPP